MDATNDSILEYQIAQLSPDALELRVVPGDQFDWRRARMMLTDSASSLVRNVSVRVKLVSSIAPATSGKRKLFVREF